jgi:hypothetical protein
MFLLSIYLFSLLSLPSSSSRRTYITFPRFQGHKAVAHNPNFSAGTRAGAAIDAVGDKVGAIAHKQKAKRNAKNAAAQGY